MKIKINLLFLLFLTMLSCTEEQPHADMEAIDFNAPPERIAHVFPKTTNVDSLKQTQFVMALEENFVSSDNIIYTPTVLMAWDELKKVYHTSTFIPEVKDKTFGLLNDTKSHRGSLDSGEYKVEIEQTPESVKVMTSFQKSLPFSTNMESFDSFLFKNESVSAFGFHHAEEKLTKNIQIVYYKNDEEFILKLLPKDTTNEILLIKGDSTSKNFKQVLKFYTTKTEAGKADRTDEQKKWRTEFIDGDELRIPNLLFNIEKSYDELIGKKYRDNHKISHTLVTLSQRNAFMLNESGAKMESVAVATDSMAVVAVEQPTVKRLFFNKDFYVLVKKKTSDSPYFAIKIVNTELMEKK